MPDAASGKPSPHLGRELRTQVLTTPAANLGIEPTPEYPREYGIVMDWPIGEDVASIVWFCDGSASLYTTSAFGVSGGTGRWSQRDARMARSTAFSVWGPEHQGSHPSDQAERRDPRTAVPFAIGTMTLKNRADHCSSVNDGPATTVILDTGRFRYASVCDAATQQPLAVGAPIDLEA